MSASGAPQRGALANWDRRVIQAGNSWATHTERHPCYTIALSTTVAFFILKGTRHFHMSLPRYMQREALQIGIWTAQLVFLGTPLLMFARRAYAGVLQNIRNSQSQSPRLEERKAHPPAPSSSHVIEKDAPTADGEDDEDDGRPRDPSLAAEPGSARPQSEKDS